MVAVEAPRRTRRPGQGGGQGSIGHGSGGGSRHHGSGETGLHRRMNAIKGGHHNHVGGGSIHGSIRGVGGHPGPPHPAAAAAAAAAAAGGGGVHHHQGPMHKFGEK